MPVELSVICAAEFVCLDADEDLDFEQTKKALQLLAQACLKRGLDRAMLDIRQIPIPANPRFTPSQLAALVRAFREAGFGKTQRLALLYRKDPHGGVRLFAFIGRIQGCQVRACSDFEEAFLWLAEGSPVRPVRSGEELPVPITRRRREVSKIPVAPFERPRRRDSHHPGGHRGGG